MKLDEAIYKVGVSSTADGLFDGLSLELTKLGFVEGSDFTIDKTKGEINISDAVEQNASATRIIILAGFQKSTEVTTLGDPTLVGAHESNIASASSVVESICKGNSFKQSISEDIGGIPDVDFDKFQYLQSRANDIRSALESKFKIKIAKIFIGKGSSYHEGSYTCYADIAIPQVGVMPYIFSSMRFNFTLWDQNLPDSRSGDVRDMKPEFIGSVHVSYDHTEGGRNGIALADRNGRKIALLVPYKESDPVRFVVGIA